MIISCKALQWTKQNIVPKHNIVALFKHFFTQRRLVELHGRPKLLVLQPPEPRLYNFTEDRSIWHIFEEQNQNKFFDLIF